MGVSKTQEGKDDGTYQVGYRRPPRHSRFKPGQSGNARGRPKGSKSPKLLLEEALRAPITVTEAGVSRTVEQRQVLFKALLAKAIKGDTRAALLIVKLMDQFGLSKASGEDNQPLIIQIASSDAGLL